LDAAAIAGWSNYFSVLVGAAATLTGLVFVAVSINLTRARRRILNAVAARSYRARGGDSRDWRLPVVSAGILLLRGSPAGFYWLVPGFMFSLFSGVASAWVLLVEILR
jgi:hypothetical protein